MAKNTETFPVSKGDSGKLFGYADAGQIARSNGRLKLFDTDAAKRILAEQEIEAAGEKQAKVSEKVAQVKAAGGADASAVKKGPPTK